MGTPQGSPWGPLQGCQPVQSPGGTGNLCLTCRGSDTWCPDASRTSYAAVCVCVWGGGVVQVCA